MSETDVQQPELKQKLASLYSYLSKHLGIQEAPNVVLSKNKENADKEELGLTGYYDHVTKTIKVFTTGRSPSDILRSFSHEIIHHWQNEHGMLDQQGEKSAIHYAQEDPNLRKREYEAFLYGSILFRDWQDFHRYGPAKIENSLPNIV